jgi:hypothetical protein
MRLPDTAHTQLKLVTVAFVVAVAIHGTDHVMRGTDVVQPLVKWAGTLQALLAIPVLGLVLRAHPAAPTAATWFGFGSALLFTASHLLPHWGPFSDSFINPAPDAGVTAFSWVTAALEIGAGLVLGAVAVRITAQGRLRQAQ